MSVTFKEINNSLSTLKISNLSCLPDPIIMGEEYSINISGRLEKEISNVKAKRVLKVGELKLKTEEIELGPLTAGDFNHSIESIMINSLSGRYVELITFLDENENILVELIMNFSL